MRIFSRFSTSVLSLMACCLIAAPWAQAASSKSPENSTKPEGYLGRFGDWQAWHNADSKDRVCYMVLSKKFPTTKKLPRQGTHLMVTHRPEEGSTDVVSYNSGYVYKAASDVTMKLGKNSFSLFTDKDTAWAREPRTDHAITRAFRLGIPITLIGTPAAKDAHAVTDNLSHKGADQTYRAISRACDVSVEKLPSASFPATAQATETKKTQQEQKAKKDTKKKKPEKDPQKATQDHKGK